MWVLTLLALAMGLLTITLLMKRNELLTEKIDTLRNAQTDLREKVSVFLQEQEDEEKAETAKENAAITILSPIANARIQDAKNLIVTGIAAPNAYIWGYINTPSSEKLGANTYANGGTTQADAGGNFTLQLAEPCATSIALVLAAVPEEHIQDEVWDAAYLSESRFLTFEGDLPGVCTQ